MARVAVALSGGVDSVVAALLLKRAGHQVLGFSLRLGLGPDLAWREGARVAAQLGIGHRVVEAGFHFGSRVIDTACREYASGRTPNPCALCNARVKFPLLWAAARQAGCRYLATGHYARLVPGLKGPLLAEGADSKKSQAYFLARLHPGLLPGLLFPLGELSKTQVRGLAQEQGFGSQQRPESQDACFLPAGGWDQLMSQRGLIRRGVVEDQQGRVLGRHQGLHRFTVGQRRGLGVAGGKPLYVLALESERAAVMVGPRDSLKASGLVGIRPLWYFSARPQAELMVRFRYRQRAVACGVTQGGDCLRVEFKQSQGAVAPGQLAVFFHQSRVVGSAWIGKAIYT